MHRACGEFASRAEYRSQTPHRLQQAAAAIIALGLCAGLTSCTDDGAYPNLAKIEDIGRVMTPEERQKAVANLQRQKPARAGEWKVVTK
jgi:hypothetical protein